MKKESVGRFFASFACAIVNAWRVACYDDNGRFVQKNRSRCVAKAVVLVSNSYRFGRQRLSVCSAIPHVLQRKTWGFAVNEVDFLSVKVDSLSVKSEKWCCKGSGIFQNEDFC